MAISITKPSVGSTTGWGDVLNTALDTIVAGVNALPAALVPTAVKTANYTAVVGDLIPVDTTSGPVTITLPTAPADKAQVAVKHVVQGSANAVTIARGGTDVFNKTGGSTSLSLTTANQLIALQYQASTGIWYVLNDSLALSALNGTFAPLPYAGSGPVYGMIPGNLKKWRAAVARVTSGTGTAKLLCVGASTVGGFGSSGGVLTSWPAYMQQMLNSYYAPTVPGWVIPPNLSADARWTVGSGWNYSGGSGPAGAMLIGAIGGSGSVTFTPGINCDTFDVWFKSGGTTTASVDGSGPVTWTTSSIGGPSFLGKFTITTTAGSSHVLTLTANTSGTQSLQLIGIDAYLSTQKSIRVANWGVSGSQSSAWVNDLSSLNAITALAPDLTIIHLGINDALNAVTAAARQANIQSIIAAASSGDVILSSLVPSNPANSPNPVPLEQAYASADLALATAQGYPFVDVTGRLIDYATSSPLGYYSDNLHLVATGYADVGRLFFSALSKV